jgi:hypothetical protein
MKGKMSNAIKVETIGTKNIRFYTKKIMENQHGRALGGVFTVCLIRDNNNRFYRGLSYCVPEDQYVKQTGRKKALGRAIQALENTKAFREQRPMPNKVSERLQSIIPGMHYSSENQVELTPEEKKLWLVLRPVSYLVTRPPEFPVSPWNTVSMPNPRISDV